MAKKQEDKKDQVKVAEQGYGTCGAPHQDCPNTWKGSCDLSSPHDGSHHCSACNSMF